jgi:hypothetical protein
VGATGFPAQARAGMPAGGLPGAAVGAAFRGSADGTGPVVSCLGGSAACLMGVHGQAAARLPGPGDALGGPGKDPVAAGAGKDLLPGPGSCWPA